MSAPALAASTTVPGLSAHVDPMTRRPAPPYSVKVSLPGGLTVEVRLMTRLRPP